ncbi:hypothetical protein ACFL5M_04065 [Candidatus Neomarinimicrobiota bacterium]
MQSEEKEFKLSEEREIKREKERLAGLASAGKTGFARREKEVSRKRLRWWEDNRERIQSEGSGHLSILDQAYRIFYVEYLGLSPKEVPIVERTDKQLVIHSHNFCPVHHACADLGLDTREVCKAIYERPVSDLLKQIHPGLRFTRNYEAIRPNTWYCEEMIQLDNSGNP